MKSMRKWIVSLKRSPQNISLLMLVVCCIIYTFQLTAHSNASMYVSSRIIALYVFIITLASMLVIFSFLNVYAKRQKHKFLMQLVVYLLMGVQIVFDALCLQIIYTETVLRDNPVPVTADIAASQKWTTIHLVALVLTLIAIVTMPVYHKLLLKINTAIQDDEASNIEGEEKLVDGDGEMWV